MKTSKTTLTFERGFARGLVAFSKGLAAAPAFDSAVVADLDGVPVGAAAPYLRGWLSGWHSANIVDQDEAVAS